MNSEIFTTKSFYAGLLLFLLIIVIAVIPLRVNIYTKIAISVLAVILYYLRESFNYAELSTKIKEKFITKILSTVDTFKELIPNQRIRSNIFICGNKRHAIKYSYGMDKYDDKFIRIPVNMGCTGEAAREGIQVWGDKAKIFQEGDYRVPKEELKKVPNDLEWICSTPIRKNGNVIAVLNFDGNKIMQPHQQETIKNHCKEISKELADYL